MSKRLKKYIAAFDYFDEALIVLSATSGGISIGAPRIVNASLNFVFSLTTGLKKNITNNTK